MDDYLRTLRTINFRLIHEPLDWGEGRYTLHELGIEMRFGTFLMLSVWYGVLEPQGLVYAQRFLFRRDYPHGQPPP
jgi:hypothetical protein